MTTTTPDLLEAAIDARLALIVQKGKDDPTYKALSAAIPAERERREAESQRLDAYITKAQLLSNELARLRTVAQAVSDADSPNPNPRSKWGKALNEMRAALARCRELGL